MAREIKYNIVDDFDYVIDEASGGNTFIALRKIQWGERSRVGLDLRKWFVGADGEDVPGKGVSFMNEQTGTNTLITTLLKNKYGDTKDVLRSIKDRDDFESSLSAVLNGDPDEEDIADDDLFYDPKQELI